MEGTFHVIPAQAGISRRAGALTIAGDPSPRGNDGVQYK